MNFLMCKHKVAEYTAWREVFDSHAQAHAEAGLQPLHVLRGIDDPAVVMMLFACEDLDKGRAFTTSLDAAEGAARAGVIGTPEVLYLTDQHAG